MRLLLANKFFFPNGGSEAVMFQERKFLLEQGHDVIDFSMLDARNLKTPYSGNFVANQDYRTASGYSKIRSALNFIHSNEAVRKFRALLDSTRPDLVHCHNIYHQLTPSIIGAAKAHGIPVILTLHDSKPVCPTYTRLSNGKPCSACISGDFSNVLKRRCAEGSLGRSALLYAEAVIQRHLRNYEKVDTFIAPSRFMRDSVSKRFHPEKIVLLYNGVDSLEITPRGIDGGYVLYLGRLSREKGVETLLRAHSRSGSNWPLVVAGSGPLAGELKEKFADARFVGHLSGEDSKKTIAGASLVVVPSECYENCPMSVLEAMAYAKPVIGSRMGGIPELVTENETGMLFEAGDALDLQQKIDTMMASPTLRESMGRKARTRAENEFSLKSHNRSLMSIYRSLISTASN